MRLWHYALLPYLPDAQFKGQLRELVAILHDWQNKGHTNHLLINRVMEYGPIDLYEYLVKYDQAYIHRYGRMISSKIYRDFFNFAFGEDADMVHYNRTKPLFDGWHNNEYLRICYANLFEKYKYGIGKSKITEEEWQKLLNGYKKITGEEYKI